MHPHGRTLAGLAAIVTVLLGAACGSSSSSGGTAAASPSPSPSPSPTPTVLAQSETVSGSSMVILTDTKGMTLYLWKKDAGTGKVDCVGQCAVNWPPFVLPAGATKPIGGPGVTGTLATETNPEGKGDQVTYNGWPLYYFIKDKAPGDTTGQGVSGVWFVVTPSQSTNT